MRGLRAMRSASSWLLQVGFGFGFDTGYERKREGAQDIGVCGNSASLRLDGVEARLQQSIARRQRFVERHAAGVVCALDVDERLRDVLLHAREARDRRVR